MLEMQQLSPVASILTMALKVTDLRKQSCLFLLEASLGPVFAEKGKLNLYHILMSAQGNLSTSLLKREVLNALEGIFGALLRMIQHGSWKGKSCLANL